MSSSITHNENKQFKLTILHTCISHCFLFTMSVTISIYLPKAYEKQGHRNQICVKLWSLSLTQLDSSQKKIYDQRNLPTKFYR